MPKKILLVDSDNFTLKLFTFSLKQAGFEVCTSSDGKTAIAEIEKCKPDLVFLEIIIPPPNGFDLLRRFQSVNMVIISSLQNKSDIDNAMALGAREYIKKEGLPTKLVVATAKRLLT